MAATSTSRCAHSGGTVNVEIKTYNRWATVNGEPVEQFVPLGKLEEQIAKDVAIMAAEPGHARGLAFPGRPSVG